MGWQFICDQCEKASENTYRTQGWVKAHEDCGDFTIKFPPKPKQEYPFSGFGSFIFEQPSLGRLKTTDEKHFCSADCLLAYIRKHVTPVQELSGVSMEQE